MTIKRAGNMEVALETIKANDKHGGMALPQLIESFNSSRRKRGTAHAEFSYAKRNGWTKYNQSTKKARITPLGRAELERRKSDRRSRT